MSIYQQCFMEQYFKLLIKFPAYKLVNMENLKRIGDSAQVVAVKRFRPEEKGALLSIPAAYDVQSRLILNKVDFGKVIGKGGQMINRIKESCGAALRGVDISEELRLEAYCAAHLKLTVSGEFGQVIDAFEMISMLLYNQNAELGGTPFAIDLAIDHSRAGRVVGSKGTMLASIKAKSGANQISVSKEPQEMQPGLMLRVIHLEGTLQAVRRCHFHILELFYNPSTPASDVGSTAISLRTVSNDLGSFGISSPVLTAAAMALGTAPLPPISPFHSSLPAPASVHISSLVARGVHQDVVRQISEIDAYINQYGLSLAIAEKIPVASQHVVSGSSRYTISTALTPHTAPTDSRKNSFFEIPRDSAGIIIGKGGSTLKELQQEFGCRIRLDTLDNVDARGARKVFVWHDDDSVHEAVKGRISSMIEKPNSTETIETSKTSTNIDDTLLVEEAVDVPALRADD